MTNLLLLFRSALLISSRLTALGQTKPIVGLGALFVHYVHQDHSVGPIDVLSRFLTHEAIVASPMEMSQDQILQLLKVVLLGPTWDLATEAEF